MSKQHPSILSSFFVGTLAMSELDRETAEIGHDNELINRFWI
jgi:hypothetical protein